MRVAAKIKQGLGLPGRFLYLFFGDRHFGLCGFYPFLEQSHCHFVKSCVLASLLRFLLFVLDRCGELGGQLGLNLNVELFLPETNSAVFAAKVLSTGVAGSEGSPIKSVRIDLSPINGPSDAEMVHVGNKVYEYTYDIPALSKPFQGSLVITASNDAKDYQQASFPFSIIAEGL